MRKKLIDMFKKIQKKQKKQVMVANSELDVVFYRELYGDLENMTNLQLSKHWERHGREERRHPNFQALLKHYGKDKKDIEDIDFYFYTSYYSDLGGKINTFYQAVLHYLEYGQKEKRFKNLKEILNARGINIVSLQSYLEKDFFQKFQELNSFLDVDYKMLIDNLTGHSFLPLKFSADNEKNANLYLDIAKIFLVQQKLDVAQKYLIISSYFKPLANTLEFLGNIALESNEYESAINYYNKALELEKNLPYVYNNLIKSYLQVNKQSQAKEILLKSIDIFPTELVSLRQKLDELLVQYYENGSKEYFNKYLVHKDRIVFLQDVKELSRTVYKSYYKLYGGEDKKENYTTTNPNKILIIGDYHVEQCIRYRINQKKEQLIALGYDVEALDWTKLENNKNKIPFYDIVIFYRVPAIFQVIKTIAQVNALGKISIYEIDDLIFDPVYPDSFENYGGSIDLDAFYSLLQGMPLFNAAASMCDYGIASTKPLCEKLERLVNKNICFLHRNGLDKNNSIEISQEKDKEHIDIFYGSGTLAHNADFTLLVLPAIEKLFNEHKKLRLIIAGHLTLPKRFLEKYKNRVVQLPKVKIEAYYSYLKQADINLAVLCRDEITDAKSELKWFEAGCYHIPSVVSDTQNYLDVINDGEDGFIAANPDEWYEKLLKLINDETLRNKMGENVAKRIANEYSIEALGTQLHSNIQEIVASKNRNKRKKIALVNVFFPPQSIGGATRVVADNFDILVDKYIDEYEICVFTSEVACIEPYQMTSYNYKGARVYKSSILCREHMDWHAKDENMYVLFQKFLEIEKPDKVHFHCVQRLTASVVEATKDMGVPYIVTVHDAWWISDHQFLVDKNGKVYPEGHPDPYHERVLPENITIDMSIERESYLKSLLHNAQFVLTVSESFAEIYQKNGIKKTLVTKNGISNSTQWKPKDTSYTEKVVCAHIGGMSAHKGYDILQAAVKKAQPKNLEFLIVDHSREESYEALEKWGTVDVRFVGRQKQENIVELYKRIDVLFAPSIWPESFGLVTREAAACGCWIVASNLGGIGEDVINGKNGFVIEPTQKALEETMNEIDISHRRYKELAEIDNISTAEEQVRKLKEFLDD